MEKIKLIADTPCDIPDEELARYQIDMPPVPITVDGQGYYERESFSIPEFYRVLAAAKEVPATSRVPVSSFTECYKRAWREEYTCIICVTINAGGSGTNASAHTARDLFFREHPEASGTLQIHVIDSKTYSAAYGHPVILAAQMAEDGKSSAEILDFLHDWFSTAEIYLGCYTLQYAKKSGRITAAAAFVGDMLGLRPVICMVDGTTKTVGKVRGDKQLIPRIFDFYLENRQSPEAPAAIVYGANEEYGRELRDLIEKDTGQKVPMYQAGASIVINSGPDMVAVVCHRKKL